MSDILKNYIREILSEEIVTLSRGKLQMTYDVSFDKDDNIVKSKKIALGPDEIEVLSSVQKIASAVPQGELLKKLRELKKAGVQLQAPAKSPNNVVKVMNAYWADTMEWPTVTRIGRGELQLRIAFKVDPEIPEPDFVSEDGVALSVKYLGNGSQTAKTGEANRKIPVLTEKLAAVIGIKKFPQGSFSGESLMTHLGTLDPRQRAVAISKARDILDQIKQSIVGEHNAAGILMLDSNNGFYLVTMKNYKDVHPVSIRNSGTRLEFTGPKLSSGITTLERALDYAEAGGRPAKKSKSSPAEPET